MKRLCKNVSSTVSIFGFSKKCLCRAVFPLAATNKGGAGRKSERFYIQLPSISLLYFLPKIDNAALYKRKHSPCFSNKKNRE
jgi:hypothetical protein